MRNVARTERKFLLDIASALSLQQRLTAVMTPDKHNASTGYPVRSLYFDTPYETDFLEKLNGIGIRRKIRLRTYDPAGDFFLLEQKQKQGDYQRKRSLVLNRQEAGCLIEGDYGILLERPESFAHEMHGFMCMKGYRPKVVVEYDRTAFIAQENSTRVTFDRNIRATEANMDLLDPDLCLYPVFEPFKVVLEVKYNGFLLSYIRTVLNQADKSELAVSKYCLGRTLSMLYQF